MVGPTKSGKVIISKELANKLDKPLVITDEVIMKLGKIQGYNRLVNIFKYSYYSNSPTIIEGVHTYRMLRSVFRDKGIYPDVIIKTVCNEETISHFYKKDKEIKKLKHALSFNKGLDTIWGSYEKLVDNRKLKSRK